MTLTRPARAASFVLLAVLASMPTAASAQELTFKEVVRELQSPDPKARLNAVQLLAESGYPEAAGPIAPLLADPDERIAKEAMYAELGFFLDTRLEAERRVALVVQIKNPSPAFRAFEGGWGALPLGPVPAEVIRGLTGLLAAPKLALRVEATYALGILAQVEAQPGPGHAAVWAALAAGLGDPEPAARAAAARAAGRVFRRCAAPCAGADIERLGNALVHSLNDPDQAVVMAVLEGIAELRYERAVQALTDFYNYEKKGPVALATLDALGRIGHRSSVPLFRAALTRKEPAALRAAVEGLARAGDKDSVTAAALSLAKQRKSEVVLGVAFAQQRVGQVSQLDRLVQAAGGTDTYLQAQDYLIELGPPVAQAVAGALPAASTAARLRLIEVLGVIGGADQLPALQAAERDETASVAAAAVRAVRRIKAR
ncbi:MAG: hypothetical protein EHM24_11885 [Acidobacteria bacterium]|nr:MAG: hypothetical protein EHM24_11885 [Acidobacteriota bacterium]